MAETDWAGEQEAIRQAIAKAAKLPDETSLSGKRAYKRVEWEGRDSAERISSKTGMIDLRLGAVVPMGKLEPRQEYDADTDRLVITYGRYERITVTAAVDVDNQDPAASAPGAIAGRIRTRLQRPDCLAILQAANVAFVEFGPTNNTDYVEDGRVISAARLDIYFAHVAWDRDDDIASDPGDYFHEVEGDGEGDLDPVNLHAGPPEGP